MNYTSTTSSVKLAFLGHCSLLSLTLLLFHYCDASWEMGVHAESSRIIAAALDKQLLGAEGKSVHFAMRGKMGI